MNDQPPERYRRSDLSYRRLERNLSLVLSMLAIATYVLVDRSSAALERAATVAQIDAVPIPAFFALVVFAAAVTLNFLFVRAETSLDLLKPLHVKQAKEASPDKAELLQKLLNRRARYVAACNLGSQTARLILVVTSFLLAPGLATFLGEQGVIEYGYPAVLLSAVLIMIPVGLLNLVAGELVPKSLAALAPEKVARLAPFIRFFGGVFSPLASLSTWVANAFTARFGARAGFDVAHQAEEEIKELVEAAQESGAIEDDERELLHSVFEFTDTVAREVMTPRVDLDAASVDTDPQEVIRIITETGHSRIPIYEGTDDDIIGIVHVKDLLLATLNNGSVSLREIMRPPLFIPENKDLHDLLSEMRTSRTQLAIVQDELGGTAGIVTIEDIIEELVGEIQDEYDPEEAPIVEDQGGYLLEGKTHLDDVNALLGSEYESDAFDTVGGYVFGLFERQPSEGESIAEAGFRFTVVETDGRRIMKLRIEPAPAGDGETGNQEVHARHRVSG